MMNLLQSFAERGAYPLADGVWLADVLACPACRERRPGPAEDQFRCQHIETCLSLRNGILYPVDWQEPVFLAEQRKVWESLEKARGTYDLPVERLLLPEDSDSRSSLDWLRTLLRSRGPLRILVLNARRGWAARALAEDGHQVVAGDVLDDPHIGLGCAVRLRDTIGPPFACLRTNPTSLPFRSETFDCVCGFETLRYLPDLEPVFREVSRVLRPGGLFLSLQEPFRGVLTTQTERLLDTPMYRLARWWLPGTLAQPTATEILELRSRLGASVHEIRRRVPFCLARAEAVGLQTTILPTAVALSLSADLKPVVPADGKRPAWLESLARTYQLDSDRLHGLIDLASQTLGYDLIPELLSHWVLVGNIDGVLLARKCDHEPAPFPTLRSLDPERARHLDPLLLACATDRFLPLYGVHAVQTEEQDRYCWIMPRAGLLVPASPALELTIGCPAAMPFWHGPMRIEFRLGTEPFPLAVVLVRAGKRVTLKLPIPPSAIQHDAVFLGITTNFGLLPSDSNPGPGCDTRLLAVQLQRIRAGQTRDDDLGSALRQVITRMG